MLLAYRKQIIQNQRKTVRRAVTTVAIGNPERHVRKASHRGSKQL